MANARGKQSKNLPGRNTKGDANFGPRTSGRSPSQKGLNDGAGTRFRDGLPPETVAIESPAEEIPEAEKLRATTLPVPGMNEKLIGTRDNYQAKRDRGLKEVR